MKERICPRCGERITDENATLCMICGTQLKKKRKIRIRPILTVAIIIAVIALLGVFLLLPAVGVMTEMGRPSVAESGGTLQVRAEQTGEGDVTVTYLGMQDGRRVYTLYLSVIAPGVSEATETEISSPEIGQTFGPFSAKEPAGGPTVVVVRALPEDGRQILVAIQV